ncbi:MAG: hypothetical protein AB7N80_04615 [Bdellovibrionales bacterium]
MDRMKLFVLLSTLLGLSACAGLTRDPRSGYAEDMTVYRASDFYQERQRNDENQVREDLGWSHDRQLSEGEQALLESRLRVRRLESKLESHREKRQYYQLKGLMRNDAERIYFLSLPTVDARERWARNRGLVANEEVHTDDIASTIEKSDISMGMSQRAVTESWGDPDLVEVAGDPVYGNERWRYSRYMSSNDGYQKETRIVYFEAGRVVGWETH